MKLMKNATALIIRGQNKGVHGKIVDIEETTGKKTRSLLATIENEAGKQFKTILDFVFVVGDSDQSISLPEVG